MVESFSFFFVEKKIKGQMLKKRINRNMISHSKFYIWGCTKEICNNVYITDC